MASLRTIKRRIRSVKNTQQITNAMSLVAASKLQRAKNKVAATRPFFEETQRVIQSIARNTKGLKHPFLNSREANSTAIVVLTSDRGLCGGFNILICKAAMDLISEKPNSSLFVVGTKGRNYFRRRRKRIERNYTGISEHPMYDDAELIGSALVSLYKDENVDEVYMIYTEFVSTLVHEPRSVKLLPLDMTASGTEDDSHKTTPCALMSYEPNEEETLDYIVPKYINTLIYGAMVESAACEQGARMTSMDAATKNAENMISKKTITYNRARQSMITQELIEIVSGANSLL